MKEHIPVRFINTRFESVVKILPFASALARKTGSVLFGARAEKPFSKNRFMKTKSLITSLAVAMLCVASTVAVPPLGTAFTYQGRLNDGGQPANGNYDLIFSLMDAETNGNSVAPVMATPNIAVQNGYFHVKLDFGPTAFDG